MPKYTKRVLTIEQVHQIKLEANRIKRREFAASGFDLTSDWTPANLISESDIRIVFQAIDKLEEGEIQS